MYLCATRKDHAKTVQSISAPHGVIWRRLTRPTACQEGTRLNPTHPWLLRPALLSLGASSRPTLSPECPWLQDRRRPRLLQKAGVILLVFHHVKQHLHAQLNTRKEAQSCCSSGSWKAKQGPAEHDWNFFFLDHLPSKSTHVAALQYRIL